VFFIFSRCGVAGYRLAGLKRTVDERLNLSKQKRGNLAERYSSRRINIHHRLIYQVMNDEKVVKIIRMWTHYE
jgi:Txe/YoeB family toxin of Txe-Axe toxin-antitoxin module